MVEFSSCLLPTLPKEDMIQTPSDSALRVIHAAGQAFPGAEIHISPDFFDSQQNPILPADVITITIQREMMIQNRTGKITAEIKIGMMGQIDKGCPIALRAEPELQSAIGKYPVLRSEVPISRKSIQKMRRIRFKYDPIFLLLCHVPGLSGRAARTAVKLMITAVAGKQILLPFDLNPRISDPPGIRRKRHPRIGRIVRSLQREGHIANRSLPIRCIPGTEPCPQI